MNKLCKWLIVFGLIGSLFLPGCAKPAARQPGVPPNTQTTAPTSAPKTYAGTMTGTWSGQVNSGQTPVPVNGTFNVTITADGAVQGSFTGSYHGDAVGRVDASGNLTATGLAAGGNTEYPTFWLGLVTLSGNSIMIQGTLTGPYLSGTFSGTGPVASR